MSVNISQLSAEIGDLRVQAGEIEDQIEDMQSRLEQADNAETIDVLKGGIHNRQGQVTILRQQIAEMEEQGEAAGSPMRTDGANPLRSSRMGGPLGAGDALPDLRAGGNHIPYHHLGSQATNREPLCFREGSGRILRALEPHERLCQEPPMVSPGDFLVGKMRGGDWSFLDAPSRQYAERISQSGDTIAGGGALITPTMSAMFLDLAREQSKIIQAGCRTIQMDSAQIVIARLTSDVTPEFYAAGEAITSSDAAYGAIVVTPRKVATITFAEREWLQDAVDAGNLVQRSHAGATGAKIDYQGLYGVAAGAEPTGLKNVSGINEVASVGTPSSYDQVSQAIREIMDDKYPGEPSSLSWIMSPREGQTYNDLKDTTGQPLQQSEWVRQVKKFYGSAIDTDEGEGEDEATSFIGDFSELCIFVRQPLSFEFLASGTALDSDGNTENALSQDKIAIRSTMRLAVVTLRPAFFTKLTGVTSA